MGRMDRDRYKEVIEDYINGDVKIRGEHPPEVKEAIDSFFHAGKMMIDYPEMTTVPGEYIANLLKSLNKYPQYTELLEDLLLILKRNEG